MKGNKGLSLVELIMTLAVVSILMAGVGVFFNSYNKSLALKEEKVLKILDKEVAMKFLWTDLIQVAPSFNNVYQVDDSGLNFFQYLPGCPTPKSKDLAKREIILSEDSRQKKFTFLALSTKREIPVFINPVNAYSVGPASKDPFKSGSLSFISLNNGDQVTKQNPEIWKEQSYLYLFSPVFLRPQTNKGFCSLEQQPKIPSYLGQLGGNRLAPVSGAKVRFDYSNPLTKKEVYSSEDDFLRKVPAMGGGSPTLILAPVAIITYEFDQEEYNGKDENVLRRTFDAGDGVRSSIVAVGIEKVIFSRKSVTSNIVDVQIYNQAGTN